MKVCWKSHTITHRHT